MPCAPFFCSCNVLLYLRIADSIPCADATSFAVSLLYEAPVVGATHCQHELLRRDGGPANATSTVLAIAAEGLPATGFAAVTEIDADSGSVTVVHPLPGSSGGPCRVFAAVAVPPRNTVPGGPSNALSLSHTGVVALVQMGGGTLMPDVVHIAALCPPHSVLHSAGGSDGASGVMCAACGYGLTSLGGRAIACDACQSVTCAQGDTFNFSVPSSQVNAGDIVQYKVTAAAAHNGVSTTSTGPQVILGIALFMPVKLPVLSRRRMCLGALCRPSRAHTRHGWENAFDTLLHLASIVGL
jgi:hypothetical protein